jgi:hypothetical protein
MDAYCLEKLNERNFYDLIAIFKTKEDAMEYANGDEKELEWKHKFDQVWTSNRRNGTNYKIEGWIIQ